MPALARKVVIAVTLCLSLFGAGYFAGSWWGPTRMEAHADDHDHHDAESHDPDHADDHVEDEHDDHEHEEEDHVALTEQAFANLKLKLQTLEPQDYWVSQTVPGRVTTIPGHSRLTVSAPMAGVIERVLVKPGEAAHRLDQLFKLRITDEALMSAQSRLLDGLTRASVLRREIDRLGPITATGAVAGKRTRELRYELAQLEASQEVVRQELRSRGMPASMLDSLVADRRLASLLAVNFDETTVETVADKSVVKPIAFESGDRQVNDDSGFVVDDIQVHTGSSVQRGDPICSLVDFSRLQIRGEAFQTDLPALENLSANGWQVEAEFEHRHDGQVESRQFPLLRIDNSLAEDSQTVVFYLDLLNEKAEPQRDSSYVHWRFKPGQRVHLRIPTERWVDKLVVPVEAIVRDGPNVMVFVEHVHNDELESTPHLNCDHDHEGEPDDLHGDELQHDEDDHDDHEEIFVELEPLHVQLLHRDERFAVLASDDNLLADGKRVAMNAAYELYQAMKAQAGGGGGHHHHHDH